MGLIRDERLCALEERLCFKFRDRSLLERALTHRSYAGESHDPQVASNERLEFLGDAALEASMAFHLYESHPDWSPEEMSRVRAAALSRSTLAQVGRELGLGDYVLLGERAQRNDVCRSAAVLCGAVEAVAGAVYLQTVAVNRYRYASHPAVRILMAPLLEAVVRQRPDVQYDAFLEELGARVREVLPPVVPPSEAQDGQDPVSLLENRLRCGFRDRSLLQQALTHGSYHSGRGGRPGPCNGRLAFVGAAFAKVSAATALHFLCPHLSEAELTRLRTVAVSNSALGRVGSAFGLGEFLLMGLEEERKGLREHVFTLADAVEAILGAVWLDALGPDPERAEFRRFALNMLGRSLDAIEKHPDEIDPKTVLRERSEKMLGIRPAYRVVSDSGPAHRKTYVVEVSLGEQAAGVGTAPSKKAAEQAAAGRALENLESGMIIKPG